MVESCPPANRQQQSCPSKSEWNDELLRIQGRDNIQTTHQLLPSNFAEEDQWGFATAHTACLTYEGPLPRLPTHLQQRDNAEKNQQQDGREGAMSSLKPATWSIE